MIYHVVLDVLEVEGIMDKDCSLLSTPRLVITPHLGASTREAQINVAVDVAQQIRQTLLGSLPESAVNIPGLRIAELATLRPLMSCCEGLGRLAMQLLSGPLERITVVVEGDFAVSVEKPEPLLLAAANVSPSNFASLRDLQGAIGVHTATRVNFVNVRQVADKHRIKLVVVKGQISATYVEGSLHQMKII